MDGSQKIRNERASEKVHKIRLDNCIWQRYIWRRRQRNALTHKTKTSNVKMMRRKAFERKTTFDRYYEMKPDIHRIRFMRTFSHEISGIFILACLESRPTIMSIYSFILWYCLGAAAQVRARQFLRHSWVKYLSSHVSQWKRIGCQWYSICVEILKRCWSIWLGYR